jgi:hypothetical protein
VIVLVIVLAAAGAMGAYALTRTIAGQPPMSLSLQPAGQVVAGARLIDHHDTDARYSGTGLKFTALVPAGWQQYRLQEPTDDVVVRFVAPDADRELRVDRVKDYYPARHVGDYLALLADPARVGADRSAVSPLTTVAPARPGAREAVMQTVYRTMSGSGDDRTTWARLIPSGTDLWVVRLTTSTAEAVGAPEQFQAIADSFSPDAP